MCKNMLTQYKDMVVLEYLDDADTRYFINDIVDEITQWLISYDMAVLIEPSELTDEYLIWPESSDKLTVEQVMDTIVGILTRISRDLDVEFVVTYHYDIVYADLLDDIVVTLFGDYYCNGSLPNSIVESGKLPAWCEPDWDWRPYENDILMYDADGEPIMFVDWYDFNIEHLWL